MKHATSYETTKFLLRYSADNGTPQLIKQALQGGENFDIHLETSRFLGCYRTTPNTATPGNCTPAMAHLNRELRTTLDLIRPEVAARFNENVRQNEAF
uniref:Uncharacterized protein n=1 Tax=Panagrolaimus superbus TaxID=310955 RepID=A0A914YVH6_9BILA